MAELVEFELSDGKTIFIEVEDSKVRGLQPVSNSGQKVYEAQKTFTEALENLKPMFDSIKQTFDDMDNPADEVDVKFGLKLTGKFGAVITAGAEASYEVTLRWKNTAKNESK